MATQKSVGMESPYRGMIAQTPQTPKSGTPASPNLNPSNSGNLAILQSLASQQATNQQTAANRPDVSTPWATQNWSQDDQGNWSNQIQLSPQQQAALDSQQQIQAGRSQAAQGMANQAYGALSQPADWSNLPGGESDQWRNTAQQAVWDLQQPGLDNARESREALLANQGITRGSEAWNREQRNLGDSEARARLMGIDAGRQEQQLQNDSRTQAIAEMMQQRQTPLNEMNALLNGQQVQNPQFGQFAQASRAETPQLLNASQMAYGAQLDSANASAANRAGWMNGLFNLGGAALNSDIDWGSLFDFGG